MELEPLTKEQATEFLQYYIIPIWNWSLTSISEQVNFSTLHYSYMELERFCHCYSYFFQCYYIIPIWNWSLNVLISSLISSQLHYSYMELERVSLTLTSLVSSPITLFLYGIGARVDRNQQLLYLQITLFLYGIGA